MRKKNYFILFIFFYYLYTVPAKIISPFNFLNITFDKMHQMHSKFYRYLVADALYI